MNGFEISRRHAKQMERKLIPLSSTGVQEYALDQQNHIWRYDWENSEWFRLPDYASELTPEGIEAVRRCESYQSSIHE